MVRITPITHRITRFALALCLCVAMLLPALPVSIVRAAGTTYYVGQLFPDDDGTHTNICNLSFNNTCTLRDAINAATSGMDTITFNSSASFGTYTLGTGAGQGTLVLANNVTITGPGSDKVAIDGGSNGGTGTIVFRVNDYVTATISGLEITHGNNQAVGGGGIYNSGSLTLTNDLIDHNNTDDIGGGVDSPGGLAATTSLTVTGCTITGNTATGGGGIYGGTNTVSITNSTITNNRGGQGNGGGGLFLATTTSTITNSTISGNTAVGFAGGGIYSFNGTLTITGTTIANNTADAPGGGGIRDTATGPLTITDSTVSGNTATGTASGGGILEQGISLTLTRVQLTGNKAGGDGGGVSATTTTPVTVTGGTVGSNTAGGNGGGIFATTATTTNAAFSSNGTGNLGGGLWIGGAATAKLTDSGSAFTGNTASSLFGGGGGLYFQQGTLALTGDSFGGNNAGSATAQGFGGGVFMANGSGTITGATFTGNSVMFDGCGGALEANAGTLAIANSLFSGNFGTQGQPCGGAIAVEGASVSVTNSAFTGNSITATTTPGGGAAVAVDSGTLTVTGSSFINNKVTNPPPNALNTVPKGGGAIELNGGTTTVTNSTFAGNMALGANTGGGAIIVDGTRAIAALSNDTFSGNSAPTGGAVWVPVGTGTLTDVIAVGSTNGTAMNRPTLDLAGTFVAASRNNLIGAADGTATGITNGGNGNQVGSLVAPLNARLGPLADNGGGALPGGAHPLTFALLPSSPAIDAGGVCGTNPATNQPLAVDQRGIARPQGNGCDIGAYEYVPVQPTITGSYRVGTGGQAITLTGTGFQRGSVVSVGGVTLPASAVTNLADNGTSLTVTLPMHAAGVVTLVVTNPGNLTSVATGNLTYVTPNATPAPATAVPTVASKPNIAPPLHPTATPPATPLPTPLPQPARH